MDPKTAGYPHHPQDRQQTARTRKPASRRLIASSGPRGTVDPELCANSRIIDSTCRMRMAAHCTTLAVGAFLVVYGGLCLNRPIEVWSDLKAFSARVASDRTAQHALRYGGESEGTDFGSILKRVWGLSDDWKKVVWAGMVLCGVGVAGIILDVTGRGRRPTVEQPARADPARRGSAEPWRCAPASPLRHATCRDAEVATCRERDCSS